MSKRTSIARTVEKVSEALADWFWGHRTASMIPEEAVKQFIKEARRDMTRADGNRLGELQVWHRLISNTRVALEQKHPGHTLIRLRGLGWRVSNDMEYADFTMGWAKRTFNAAARTMDLAPHMNKSCIGDAVKKAFGTNESEIKRLAHARHDFALTVQGWRKEIKGNGKTEKE